MSNLLHYSKFHNYWKEPQSMARRSAVIMEALCLRGGGVWTESLMNFKEDHGKVPCRTSQVPQVMSESLSILEKHPEGQCA
jgi:hypothetical protein